MTEKEHEIVQEEKAIAFMNGVVIGVTGTCILFAIVLTLINYGL